MHVLRTINKAIFLQSVPVMLKLKTKISNVLHTTHRSSDSEQRTEVAIPNNHCCGTVDTVLCDKLSVSFPQVQLTAMV